MHPGGHLLASSCRLAASYHIIHMPHPPMLEVGSHDNHVEFQQIMFVTAHRSDIVFRTHLSIMIQQHRSNEHQCDCGEQSFSSHRFADHAGCSWSGHACFLQNVCLTPLMFYTTLCTTACICVAPDSSSEFGSAASEPTERFKHKSASPNNNIRKHHTNCLCH